MASGNHWWMNEPRKPPVIAPRKSEGANTPPEPPEPMVIEVARILAISSTPSVVTGSDCVSAIEIVLYPTPKTFGSATPMAPTSRPPRPAFR